MAADIYGTKVVAKDGRIVAMSKNLRGMRDFARKSRVDHVVTCRDPRNTARGLLTVIYADGSQCVASFASFHIMIDFVRNRRSWRGATFDHKDGDMGYLTKPGIIGGDV